MGPALRIAPPATGEYAPFHRGYVDRVAESEVPRLLTEQGDRIRRLTGSLDEAGALGRYAPGKWSVKQVIGHITDSERVFSYRLLRIARGDHTPLPGFEQDGYVAAADFDARPLGDLVADFERVRAATHSLIAGLDAAAWERSGIASDAPVTSRALLYIILGHVEHHLAILRERYGLAE